MHDLSGVICATQGLFVENVKAMNEFRLISLCGARGTTTSAVWHLMQDYATRSREPSTCIQLE